MRARSRAALVFEPWILIVCSRFSAVCIRIDTYLSTSTALGGGPASSLNSTSSWCVCPCGTRRSRPLAFGAQVVVKLSVSSKGY